MAQLISRASVDSVPNRRWNFRELVRNPVRTNDDFEVCALKRPAMLRDAKNDFWIERSQLCVVVSYFQWIKNLRLLKVTFP